MAINLSPSLPVSHRFLLIFHVPQQGAYLRWSLHNGASTAASVLLYDVSCETLSGLSRTVFPSLLKLPLRPSLASGRSVKTGPRCLDKLLADS